MGKVCFRGFNGKVETSLYKYYSNFDFAEDAIRNNRIHLELPKNYNDIYDSSFYATTDTLKRCFNTSKNLYDILINNLPKKYHSALTRWKNSVRNEYYSIFDVVEYICENSDLPKKETITDCILIVTGGSVFQADNNKISCFSEKNNSLLMWAYYANNCMGVCLEFDTASDPVLGNHCHKVQYTNTFIPDGHNFDNYFRKSEQWSHEQEWRIVCETNEEYLPTKSLTKIILGYKIPNKEFEKFLCLGREKRLDVFQIKPSTDQYELLMEPILINK